MDGAASAPLGVARERLRIVSALKEFELIGKYFARLGAERPDVRLGVGDDGAVVMPPASRELVMVTDSLVEGVHFPPGSPAARANCASQAPSDSGSVSANSAQAASAPMAAMSDRLTANAR